MQEEIEHEQEQESWNDRMSTWMQVNRVKAWIIVNSIAAILFVAAQYSPIPVLTLVVDLAFWAMTILIFVMWGSFAIVNNPTSGVKPKFWDSSADGKNIFLKKNSKFMDISIFRSIREPGVPLMVDVGYDLIMLIVMIGYGYSWLVIAYAGHIFALSKIREHANNLIDNVERGDVKVYSAEDAINEIQAELATYSPDSDEPL